MTDINIWWERPLSKKKIDKLKNSEDVGLYQIYGTHHVYGSNVLLYIGRTTDQNFSSRLNSRGVIEGN